MPEVLYPIEQLPAGATKFRLVGLSPDTQYTFAIAHLEPAPSTGFSTPVSVTFITSATVGTCADPDDPVPFSLLNRTYSGVAFYNNEPVPGTTLVVQISTETSVGSGSYGAWSELDRQPVPPFSWMIERVSLPPDGLKRSFQCKATRPGVVDSNFTKRVALDPSLALFPSDFPVPVPADMLIEPVAVVLPSGMTVALAATYTPPTDHQFERMDYLVQPETSPGLFGTGSIYTGGNTGEDVVLAAAGGGTYQVTPYTVTTGAPGLVIITGIAIVGTRNAGSSYVLTVPSISNIPVIAVASVDATTVTYKMEFDNGTAYIRVFSQVYASDPGTVDSVELVANYIGPDLDPTHTTLQLAVTSGNPYRVTTFVPYTNAGIRGIAETIKSVRVGGATPPSAPTAAVATFTGTGGSNGGTGPSGGNWAFPNWVGVKVTFNTTPTAGDSLTLLRGGIVVDSYVITSADVTAGHAILFDPNPTVAGSVYVYSAQQIAVGGGASAASSTTSITVRSAFKLSAPSALTLTQTAYPAPVVATLTMPTDGELPPGAVANIVYITGLGSASYSGALTVPPFTQLTTVGAVTGSWSITWHSGYTYVRVTIQCPGYTDASVVGAFKLNAVGIYIGIE